MFVISSMCHIYVSAHECQKSFLELDRYGLSDVDGGNETWVQLPECSAARPGPQNHQIIYVQISVAKLFQLNKEAWIWYV